MKNKVKPTVEKWWQTIQECVSTPDWTKVVSAINGIRNHSVQEAKAEEMYKERNLWIVAIQSALFYGTNLKTLRNHLKGMLPDAPSKNKISDPQKNLPVESVSHIKAVNGERL